MPNKRIVASVTWGKCGNIAGRPHLGELTLLEGTEEEMERIMRLDNLAMWKVRIFACRYCRSHIRLAPTALMFEDVHS